MNQTDSITIDPSVADTTGVVVDRRFAVRVLVDNEGQDDDQDGFIAYAKNLNLVLTTTGTVPRADD